VACILVVDDNMDLLGTVGWALSEAGHKVTTTNNGADALALLARQPLPDVLLLDVVMPGLDGHEVLRNLPTEGPPVVIVTGSGGVTPGEALSPKVVRVLTKPFDLTKLTETVDWVLAKRVENKPEISERKEGA
jgi:putative two-component system response regulator